MYATVAALIVFHVVPSLSAAQRAARAGVDGLVVEGSEGAGFKNPREVSTMVLLPLVCQSIDLPADIGSLSRTITVAFYLCVAVGGVAGTGLMALYYARRTRIIREFLGKTPEWIVQTMRAAA